MPLGATVRRMLGPRLEAVAAARYRGFFIDLDQLAARLETAIGSGATERPISIAEVGCGEGWFSTALAHRFPAAQLTGIDISPNVGVNYRGDSTQATFATMTVAELAGTGAVFDLVLVVDVVHHVPPNERAAFLRDCARLVRPGGDLVVKEWERRRNVAHLAAWTSDYVISGDRGVRFSTDTELRAALSPLPCELIDHDRVRPRVNNVLYFLRAAQA